MKQNIGPIAIAVAAVALIALLVFLWRTFLPPTPDFSTTTKIPDAVRKNREMSERFKAGDRSFRNSAPQGKQP